MPLHQQLAFVHDLVRAIAVQVAAGGEAGLEDVATAYDIPATPSSTTGAGGGAGAASAAANAAASAAAGASAATASTKEVSKGAPAGYGAAARDMVAAVTAMGIEK